RGFRRYVRRISDRQVPARDIEPAILDLRVARTRMVSRCHAGTGEAVYFFIRSLAGGLLLRTAHQRRHTRSGPLDHPGHGGRYRADLPFGRAADQDLHRTERRVMPEKSDNPVLRFENVSVSFDDHPALIDVSFETLEGESRVILGAPGVE